MSGSLIVVRGDLTQLMCDAILVPTSAELEVTSGWKDLFPGTGPGRGDWWKLDVTPPATWTVGVRSFRARVEPSGRALWLMQTGWDDGTPDWVVDGVVEAVGQAAAGVDRQVCRRSKPLIGVPLAGTGAGGLAGQRGTVIRLLLPALGRAAVELDVDVALVLYDDADHAAVQGQRNEPHPELGHLAREADRLGALAADRQLSLFLGAGVSLAAGLPDWKTLLEELAVTSGLGPTLTSLPPLDAAQVAQAKMPDFEQWMVERFRTTGHSLAHSLLASLECEAVLTTNYDDCYERARPEVSVLPRQRARAGSPWLLKLHGDVARPSSIVLTREQYLHHDEASAPLVGLVQAQLLTKHLLFVGFSLVDDTFARLTHQVLRLLRDSGAGSQHLGTVLQVTDNPAVQALYSEGLAHLSVAEEESSVARAARRLELFLDRLAWTAAREREGSERYLLDRRYDGLVRPRAESRLRERLLRLLGEVSSAEQGTHAWHVVADALAKLGYTAPR